MSNNDNVFAIIGATAIAAVVVTGVYQFYKVKRFSSAVDTYTAKVDEIKKEYRRGHTTKDVAMAQLRVAHSEVIIAAEKWADHEAVYQHLNSIFNLAATHINNHTV